MQYAGSCAQQLWKDYRKLISWTKTENQSRIKMSHIIPDIPRIYRFALSFEGWSPALEAFPIVNAEEKIVGGFTIGDGPTWNCFLSGKGYPESLFLGDGKCFITPRRADDGSINELVVSIQRINDESRTFNPEEE
jgi:hypothetical protein